MLAALWQANSWAGSSYCTCCYLTAWTFSREIHAMEQFKKKIFFFFYLHLRYRFKYYIQTKECFFIADKIQISMLFALANATGPLRLKLNNIHYTKSLTCNMGLIACTFDQQKLTCLHILVFDSCAPTPISICCSFPQSIATSACTVWNIWKSESIVFITALSTHIQALQGQAMQTDSNKYLTDMWGNRWRMLRACS